MAVVSILVCSFGPASAQPKRRHRRRKAGGSGAAPGRLEILRWRIRNGFLGMFCTKVDEPTDPPRMGRQLPLCKPRSRPEVVESGAHRRNGLYPVRREVRPDGWSDNYLCAPRRLWFPVVVLERHRGYAVPTDHRALRPAYLERQLLCAGPPAGKGRSMPSAIQRTEPISSNLIRARRGYQSYWRLARRARGEFRCDRQQDQIGVDPDRKSNARFPDDPR